MSRVEVVEAEKLLHAEVRDGDAADRAAMKASKFDQEPANDGFAGAFGVGENDDGVAEEVRGEFGVETAACE